MSVAVMLPACVSEMERMSLGLAHNRPPAYNMSENSTENSASHCQKCAKVRTISCKELVKRMEHPKTLLLLDCRAFVAFGLGHIRGALNISCCDRFTKRKLQNGKAGVGDLVCGSEAKALFKELFQAEIVIYDENSSNMKQLTDNSPLHVVMCSLLNEGKEISVLKGGLHEFQSQYNHLCTKPQSEGKQPLYSPTTPVCEPQIETTPASKILPFLYLGNDRDAANADTLREHGITHVLNCTSHLPFHFEGSHLVYKRLPASDSAQQNLRQYFQDAFDFIDAAEQSGGRVLIHCQAGVSRSATLTIAYIMTRTTLPMVDVYKYVKNRRVIIAPNFNFMGQLLEFENGLKEGRVPRTLVPELKLEPIDC